MYLMDQAHSQAMESHMISKSPEENQKSEVGVRQSRGSVMQ